MRTEAAIELTGPAASQTAQASTSGPLDPVIFGALLVLMALVAIPYGSVPPWAEAVFECSIFALGAMWIIDGLLKGAWGVREPRLFVPLIAIIVFAFVQAIPWGGSAAGIQAELWRSVSTDPYETRRFGLKLLALTLSGLLLLRYTSNQRRLHMLIHVVIGIGVASAVFGILRQVFQGNAPNALLPQLSFDRSYAQFIDRNHFAFLIEMVLGLVLALMLGRGMRRDRRLIYLAVAFLLWAALVLSSSRGGIFTMVCQLLFLGLLFSAPGPSRTTRREESSRARVWLQRLNKSFMLRAALIMCLMLGVTVSIVWVGGDPLMHRLETMPREFSANDDDKRINTRRVEIWQATWRLIKVHPITGIGFGAYWISFPAYHDASGPFTPDEAQLRPLAAHNDYLELLASGGLIGAALGAWFIISLIRCSLERLRSSRDPFRRTACFGALIGMFGVGVHSLVDFGLHDTVNAFIFTALVVIATVNLATVPSDMSLSAAEGRINLTTI